jgi:hypothetical protein
MPADSAAAFGLDSLLAVFGGQVVVALAAADGVALMLVVALAAVHLACRQA